MEKVAGLDKSRDRQGAGPAGRGTGRARELKGAGPAGRGTGRARDRQGAGPAGRGTGRARESKGDAEVSGIATMLASPLFGRLLRFFRPLVMGTVITTIGVTLMPVAVLWAGGGKPAAPDFGNPAPIVLATFTLLVVLGLASFARGFVRNTAVLLGIVIGTIAALLFGLPSFRPVPILVMVVVMLVAATGIRILHGVKFEGTNSGLIVGVSVGLGLIPVTCRTSTGTFRRAPASCSTAASRPVRWRR